MKPRHMFRAKLMTRLLCGVGLTLGLAACAGTPRWGAWSTVPTGAQRTAGRMRLDEYAYYPRYQIYFNAARGEYTFRENLGWVTRPLPPWSTPPELLELSPVVALHFPDEPERHHGAVRRLYPGDRDQVPSGVASRE